MERFDRPCGRASARPAFAETARLGSEKVDVESVLFRKAQYSLELGSLSPKSRAWTQRTLKPPSSERI